MSGAVQLAERPERVSERKHALAVSIVTNATPETGTLPTQALKAGWFVAGRAEERCTRRSRFSHQLLAATAHAPGTDVSSLIAYAATGCKTSTSSLLLILQNEGLVYPDLPTRC